MTLDPRCRGCGRRVVWARRAMDGKLVAFDAEPSESGRYDLRDQPDGTTVAVADETASPAFVDHADACPALDALPGRST